jgi:hypothetical protein
MAVFSIERSQVTCPRGLTARSMCSHRPSTRQESAQRHLPTMRRTSRSAGWRSEALEASKEGVPVLHSCRSSAGWRVRSSSMADHVSPVRPVRLPPHRACERSRPLMDHRTESLDSESMERSRFLASDDRVCSIVLDSGSRLTCKRSLDDPPSVIPTVRLTCHTWVPPAL